MVTGAGRTKTTLRPSTSLYPMPAVLVSSAAVIDGAPKQNLITVAWTGIACAEPPMVSVAIRKTRLSHRLISSSGEFVVNIPRADLCRAVDLCGNVSGRQADKFALAGLRAVPASVVGAPVVAECPVALECRVRHVFEAGSHDLFIGEIVAVQADPGVLDDDGRIDVRKVDPLCYGGGHYFRLDLDRVLGSYGYSRE